MENLLLCAFEGNSSGNGDGSAASITSSDGDCASDCSAGGERARIEKREHA